MVQPDLRRLDRQVNTGSIVAMWTDIESIVHIYVYTKKHFHSYDQLICLSAAFISRVASVRLACVQGPSCFGVFEDSPYNHNSGSSVLPLDILGRDTQVENKQPQRLALKAHAGSVGGRMDL